MTETETLRALVERLKEQVALLTKQCAVKNKIIALLTAQVKLRSTVLNNLERSVN